MGNDVSVSASDFTSSNVRTHKFGCYNSDFSTFEVTEATYKLVKSSHLNSSLTCFSFSGNDDTVSKECFKNALVLRSVRHPSIVKFLDAIQQSWLTGIVTELVSPLENYLQELFPDEAVQGFHSICSALAFLHTRAQLSHNNVSERSIYCTSQSLWKLGNFELCQPFSQMSLEALKKVKKLLGDGCAIDNEEAYQFNSNRIDAFDLYCFGRTILAICDAVESQANADTKLSPCRQLDQLRNLAKNSLCAASPANRTPASRLQRHAAFASHSFTRLAAFLADFSLKSEDELRQFYVGLKSQLFGLPEALVARRLGRLLLGRLPLTHPMASTYLLPYLLRPYRGPSRPPGCDCLLSEAEFRRELVPYLAMVLRIRDLPVRCALLDHFPAYCHLLDWRLGGAHRSLIPELLLGLRDRHDQLVARTHLAVAALLPLVGYAALFGDKADLARQSFFTDAQPRRRLLGDAQGGANSDGGGGGSGDPSAGGPLPLRDLAVLSDRYRGPEAAAEAEAQRQAAFVEAESARILAERRRINSQPIAEESAAAATARESDDAASSDGSWGDDWDGADASASSAVQPLPFEAPGAEAVDGLGDNQPPQAAAAPVSTPPNAASSGGTGGSTGGGLTAEALTIRPVLTAAGRQIDEFLAELEPSIAVAVTASDVAMATKPLPAPKASLAVVGSWSDDDDGGDAWGLDDADAGRIDDGVDSEQPAGPGRSNGLAAPTDSQS